MQLKVVNQVINELIQEGNHELLDHFLKKRELIKLDISLNLKKQLKTLTKA